MNEKLDKIIAELPKNTRQIVCEYYGSGDSGDFENPVVTDSDAHELVISKELDETITNFMYDHLEKYHGGWEINEGSSGNITIDLMNRTIVVSHDEYYQEANHSEDVEDF